MKLLKNNVFKRFFIAGIIFVFLFLSLFMINLYYRHYIKNTYNIYHLAKHRNDKKHGTKRGIPTHIS